MRNNLTPVNNFEGFDERVLTVSNTEILTRAEAKLYAKISNTVEDDLVDELIKDARELCEGFISRDIISKTREQYYSYAADDIELNWAPLDTDVTITATVEGVATTDFEVLGTEDPIVRFPGPVRDLVISFTTKGVPGAKNGVRAALAWLYEGRLETPMSNFERFLVPYVKLYV